jgi:hypothetical protein
MIQEKDIIMFGKLIFSKTMCLYGVKENFGEYSPNLAFVELTSSISMNYSIFKF